MTHLNCRADCWTWLQYHLPGEGFADGCSAAPRREEGWASWAEECPPACPCLAVWGADTLACRGRWLGLKFYCVIF